MVMISAKRNPGSLYLCTIEMRVTPKEAECVQRAVDVFRNLHKAPTTPFEEAIIEACLYYADENG